MASNTAYCTTVHTRDSDVNHHYSLLDYFLCSPSLLADVNTRACILVDGENVSDHFAITCSFKLQICIENMHGDIGQSKKTMLGKG